MNRPPDDPHPDRPPEEEDEQLPVAGSRIRMLKASYFQAWLYFFLIVSLLVAWWVPLNIWLSQRAGRRVADRGTLDAESFVVLAYAGISDQPEEISPVLFREHIRALREAGYVTITLDEVRSLLRDGAPVPRRALLLTFDQSRKSSYFDARRIMRRSGYHGVMFIWTRPILEGEPASLRWPYIRSMLRGGLWEIGAQSHDGFSFVTADPHGSAGPFLTRPRWIGAETRYETPEEFERRLADDHARCRAIIERETQRPPRAFAFPYGDFGQYDERAVLTRHLNLDLVGRYYDLGFILGSSALNTRHQDPRRLNRLLVEPDWTAEELLARLEHAWPREEFPAALLFSEPKAWLPDWGAFALLEPGRVRLAATPQTTGAKAWVNGSSALRDFTLETEFSLQEGQLGFFLRGTPDGECYVYLGLDTEGQLWLRQKMAGLQPVTIASTRAPLGLAEHNRLEIAVRDHLFYAHLNGRPLFKDVVRLRGQAQPGMIGVSVWYPFEDVARVELSSLDIRSKRETVATWAPLADGYPRLTAWLARNGYRFSHGAPPWLRFGARGILAQPGWDPGLLQAVAGIYRMRLTPEIRLDDSAGIETVAPEALAARVGLIPSDGILLDLTRADPTLPLSTLTAWIQRFHDELAGQGRQLLVRVPRYLEQAVALQAVLGVLPNLRLAAAPDSRLAEQDRRAAPGERRVVLIEEAMLPEEDLDLALYYELSRDDEKTAVMEPELRGEILRRRGHAAFQAGQFQRAIEIWNEWHADDPGNEEPLTLIGDVHLRMGETEQAMAYYLRSLDINPGQIALALRFARLLDNQDRPEEAMQYLNTYARIFPEHPEITLAQAEWLRRRGRTEESGRLIRRVIERNPDDLRARALLHGLLVSPGERYENMRRIVETGSQPGLERTLAEVSRDHDLTLLPEGRLLQRVFARLAVERPAPENRLFEDLLPLPYPVVEEFKTVGLSEHWTTSMPVDPEMPGSLLLETRPIEAEAYLRLLRSDTLYNGFVDVTIDAARGFFWLYARRGLDSMVRFGFDEDDRVYLQVWRDGQILVNQNRAWARPSGPLNLRLEIQGGGAVGLVNGQSFFHAPVRVPSDMPLGWWGVAPYAPGLGIAQATIREVSGGPLPVRIAFFPDDPAAYGTSKATYLQSLEPYARDLSAVAPQWFVHDLDGRVRTLDIPGEADVRIFSRYYRLHLLPAIRSVTPDRIDVAHLRALAAEHHLDGFVLMVLRMPSEAWFEAREAELAGVPLHLVVARRDPDRPAMEIREVSGAAALFPGPRRLHTVPLLPAEPEKRALPREDLVLAF